MVLFGREQINELFATLQANRLRTILTGFAVGWGILILVILLSAGRGVSNGIRHTARALGLQESSVSMQVGYIQIPQNGLKQWNDVRLNRSVLAKLVQANPQDISLASPSKRCYNQTLEYDGRSKSASVTGVEPSYIRIKSIRFQTNDSRFINQRDAVEQRKVVVLPESVATSLFSSSKQAMGQVIMLSGIAFKVVGIYKGREGMNSECFIPLSTLELLHLGQSQGYDPEYLSDIELICPNVRTQSDCDSLERRLERQLAAIIGASSEDKSLLSLSSARAGNQMMDNIILGIESFLWLIGLSTLFIGLVGVITIMQVTIAERKKEIGIRKALGAQPRDIIIMVLSESVCITVISGLLGLMTGVGLMALVEYIQSHQSRETFSFGLDSGSLFMNPTISLEMACGALFVMLVGGLLAGYLPARRAIKIPVVEAMRN